MFCNCFLFEIRFSLKHLILFDFCMQNVYTMLLKFLKKNISLLNKRIRNIFRRINISFAFQAIDLLKDYVPGCIENSGKMEILFCMIRESIALGDRLLVFSQSLITLDLIEQFLQMNVVPGETQKWSRNTSYYRKSSLNINTRVVCIKAFLIFF